LRGGDKRAIGAETAVARRHRKVTNRRKNHNPPEDRQVCWQAPTDDFTKDQSIDNMTASAKDGREARQEHQAEGRN
jgi:hypothetical protein